MAEATHTTRFFSRSAGSFFPALLLVCLLLGAGCHTTEKYPPYSPHENLLSIAAEFAVVASLDPYLDNPGTDLTGQSIARATLVRLSNYEALHPGRLTPEVRMYKGRALELLGDFASARRNYHEAAEYDTPLRTECRRRIEHLEQLIVAATPSEDLTDVDSWVRALGAQGDEFRRLARNFEDPFFRALARREAERADVARVEVMIANRYVLRDGEQQAVRSMEQLVANHRDSRRGLEHALRLARLHRTLAEDEVRLHPPEESSFSLDRFRNHYDTAVDLMYRISQADGRPERLVARHELDALLAWGEMIRARAR